MWAVFPSPEKGALRSPRCYFDNRRAAKKAITPEWMDWMLIAEGGRAKDLMGARRLSACKIKSLPSVTAEGF